jgi:hypothetical protein
MKRSKLVGKHRMEARRERQADGDAGATRRRLEAMTIRSTWRRCAPKAVRAQNSFVRCASAGPHLSAD